MNYNINFLVAALIFLLVLWFHLLKQRQYAGNENEKTFQLFMIVGIGDILLDIISTVMIGNKNPEYTGILCGILVVFYLCQLLVPCVLYLYTLTLAGWSLKEKFSAGNYIVMAPTLIMAVLVVSNGYTGILFSVTPDGS